MKKPGGKVMKVLRTPYMLIYYSIILIIRNSIITYNPLLNLSNQLYYMQYLPILHYTWYTFSFSFSFSFFQIKRLSTLLECPEALP